MSAKLLYNLSDENPNLNKQFGCMNGIFQVFSRQQYPAKPVVVSGDKDKSLPPGERRDLVVEIDKETERSNSSSINKKKKKKSETKEKHRVSCESSSSRPSFSSSPRSSSFSSIEVSSSYTASQFDQPNNDLKELVKGSINREIRTIASTQKHQPNLARISIKESSLNSQSRSGMGFKVSESHRLSYDEKEMRNNLKDSPRLSLDSHRRSNSSVVAKLMGLEDNNLDTDKRKENLFCDSPRPKFTTLQRSRSVGSIKKILPIEPAPWKQIQASDNAVTVYGEIQKRLKQLEFKKSGKDLRALKQILEAMEKTQHQMIEESKAASIVVMKPHNIKASLGKQNAMDLTPRPSLYKNNTSKTSKSLDSCSMKKPEKTKEQQSVNVSPRTKSKKLGFERQPRPLTPKSDSCKIQRQQQVESISPRRKQIIKSNSNISLRSNFDIQEIHTPKQKSPDIRMKQDRIALKPLQVTVEQPSPVSVLDASFDEEDSPSPVKKLSLPEEYIWINKPTTSVCRSILLPDYNLLECFSEEDSNFTSDNHKYISEILSTSGLLRDIEYSMISIQLNQTRLPINPELFYILEQNKRGRGFRQQQTEKIRRKLVFDTVNEILAKIFTSEGCNKPSSTLTTMEKRSKAEKLLQTLCLEIDRLQESKCIMEEEEDEDLKSQGLNLKEFEGESPWIVLDIERMIFRDLVNEVCFF